MKNSKTTNPTTDTVPFPTPQQSAALRLLDKLKSPLLKLASQLPLTTKPQPHRHLSPGMRQVATAIESLSGGRFSLAREQRDPESDLSLLTRLKVYDHTCGHYSWLTVGQMDALQNRLDKWCAYCAEEPMSFQHIGGISDCQRFVELRSGGRTHFNPRNIIDDADFTDIMKFNCLASTCKGLFYEIPFSWFLYESKPLSSFPDLPIEHTCGCPACTDRQIIKSVK
jgi:hypothetical protein